MTDYRSSLGILQHQRPRPRLELVPMPAKRKPMGFMARVFWTLTALTGPVVLVWLLVQAMKALS